MRHEKLQLEVPKDTIEVAKIYVTQTELDYLTIVVGGTAGPGYVGCEILDALELAGGRSGTDTGSKFKKLSGSTTRIVLKDDNYS